MAQPKTTRGNTRQIVIQGQNPLSAKVIRKRLQKLRGIIKGGPCLTKELEAERAQDLEIEERKFESFLVFDSW
jgi:hypothetical protein